jgi:hypothetical protein
MIKRDFSALMMGADGSHGRKSCDSAGWAFGVVVADSALAVWGERG